MRRQKLSRQDRDKRQAKRERRAAIPRQRRRQELAAQLYRAQAQYALACEFPQQGERAVCEQCGLEQTAGQGEIPENGLVIVAQCDVCGHEYAETMESYA